MRPAALLLLAIAALQPAATYEHSLAGNPADVRATGRGGYVLAGGGTDQESAFRWLIARAGGGDIVVIRASGADAYNQWILDLGGADSVETIVFRDRAAASDPFVIARLRAAEAVFIAGGDQSRYVAFWQGTPVEDELHALVARGGVIGGTSAGLAILGEYAFGARHDTVTSADALADPFRKEVALDKDFLSLPHLERLITDSHFVERDRLGRTLVFLAKLQHDGWEARPRAIAVDRETAVLIEPSGRATIAGKNTAYFISTTADAETFAEGKPLTMRGLDVYRADTATTFDLATWSGKGGVAYRLDVVKGVITSARGSVY